MGQYSIVCTHDSLRCRCCHVINVLLSSSSTMRRRKYGMCSWNTEHSTNYNPSKRSVGKVWLRFITLKTFAVTFADWRQRVILNLIHTCILFKRTCSIHTCNQSPSEICTQNYSSTTVGTVHTVRSATRSALTYMYMYLREGDWRATWHILGELAGEHATVRAVHLLRDVL